MPTDTNGVPNADPTRIESDTPMFAPIRTTKRGEKGSFFSNLPPESARAAEPRSFSETPVAATPATGERLDTVDPTDTAFATAPMYAGGRTTTARRNSAMAPMAIAGGLVLLAGVAAAGWYASQPHDNGMAQLTPGTNDVTISRTTTAPADQLAQAPPAAPEPAAPPAGAKPTVTAKAEPAPRPARARAPSRAAEDEGVNASAIAPAPLRPAPVTPPVNPAPPQAAPAPSPTPVTPPPADTPLPTQTAPPAPPQQSPTPPPTEIPPQ